MLKASSINISMIPKSSGKEENSTFSVGIPWFFIVASVFGFFFIVVFFSDPRLLGQVSIAFKFPYFLIAIILAFAAVGLDAIRLMSLARFARMNLEAASAIRTVFVYAFFSAVTPTSLGGEISQVWLLFHRDGINGAAAAVITFMRSTLMVAVNMLLVICAAMIPNFMNDRVLSIALRFSAIVCILGISFIAIAVLWRITRAHGNLPECETRDSQPVERWSLTYVWSRLSGFTDSFLRILLSIDRKRIVWLLLAVLLTLVQLITVLAIAPVSAEAVGITVKFTKPMILVAVLQLASLFVPIPGNAGAAKVGYAFILGTAVPSDQLVVATFLWRVCSCYLRALIGGVLSLFIIQGSIRRKR